MLSLNLNHKEQNKKQAKAKAELLDQSLGCLTFAVKFQTKVPAGLIFFKGPFGGAYIQRSALLESILHYEFWGATCKGLFSELFGN